MRAQLVGLFGESRKYLLGECRVILSGPAERAQIGWHLSISHPSRYPTWEEQKAACRELIPDGVYLVQIMPPKRDHISIHQNCFHWWQANPELIAPKLAMESMIIP